MIITVSGRRPLIQNSNRAGVRFRAYRASESLPQFDQHIRKRDGLNIRLNGIVFFSLKFRQSVRIWKRQTRKNQQGYAVAGEIHALPEGTGRQQDASGGFSEFVRDIRRVFVRGIHRPVEFPPIQRFFTTVSCA